MVLGYFLKKLLSLVVGLLLQQSVQVMHRLIQYPIALIQPESKPHKVDEVLPVYSLYKLYISHMDLLYRFFHCYS